MRPCSLQSGAQWCTARRYNWCPRSLRSIAHLLSGTGGSAGFTWPCYWPCYSMCLYMYFLSTQSQSVISLISLKYRKCLKWPLNHWNQTKPDIFIVHRPTPVLGHRLWPPIARWFWCNLLAADGAARISRVSRVSEQVSPDELCWSSRRTESRSLWVMSNRLEENVGSPPCDLLVWPI